MIHQEPSPLKGKSVKIKEGTKHLQVPDFDQQSILIEDWWDRVGGKSWMASQGVPGCLVYGLRIGFVQGTVVHMVGSATVPIDDEVLYGKINGLGHLVHIQELQLEE